MKIKINCYLVFTSLFFFLYFFSYIDSNTTLKYLSLVFYQIYLLSYIKKKDNIRKNPTSIYIYGLSLSLIISLFANFNTSGFIKTISLIDLLFFTYVLFPKGMNKSLLNNNIFMEMVSNSLFLVLLFSFVYKYNDVNIYIGRSTGDVFRHLFGMGEVSIVGFLCFILFSFSFYLLNISKDKKKKLFCLCKMGLGIYMAYLANIRSALFVMLFFALYYLYSSYQKIKYKKLLGILLFFCLIVAGFIYLLESSLDYAKLNYLLSNRLLYISNSINEVILSNNVIWGMGSFRNSDVGMLTKIQVDNCYVDIFYQYGAITVLFFIGILLSVYLKLKKNIINNINNGFEKKFDNFIYTYFYSVVLYSMVEKNLFSLSSALSVISFIIFFCFLAKQRNTFNK